MEHLTRLARHGELWQGNRAKGRQILSLQERASPVFVPLYSIRRNRRIFPVKFTWFIFSVVSGASRNFLSLSRGRCSSPSLVPALDPRSNPSAHPLVRHSVSYHSTRLRDFYGDNPPTRGYGTDTCFICR